MTGENAGKTFEISYGLTDEEIRLLARAVYQKQLKMAPLGKYVAWIVIALGVALGYAGGAVAHGYYGVPLNSDVSALVMALFMAFWMGSIVYWWLLRICERRISVWRIARHKETVCLKMNKGGLTVSRPGVNWNSAWEAIEDVTFPGASVIFWHGKEAGVLVPLRTIAPAEERRAFVEAAKAWSKAGVEASGTAG